MAGSVPLPWGAAMRLAAVVIAALGFASGVDAADPVLTPAPTAPGFPKFDIQEIATDLKIGYAVVVADIDGDGKPDLVVVDQHRVVWYQNPTWKVRTILTGKTKPDNVCVAAFDLDGGGDIELVIGAGWKPFDTDTPGTLQWLKRGKTLDDEWTVHAIPCDEPTVHRVTVADLKGDGKLGIVMAPLMGRGATAKRNWFDGRPVRILAYPVPADPVKGPWVPTVLNEDLHVVHNMAFHSNNLFMASYEGVTRLQRHVAAWEKVDQPVRAGNRANLAGSRGSSEVAVEWWSGKLVASRVATVEPWHGNQIVVYEQGKREVIDDHLRWGHAVKFLPPNVSDVSMLVAGVRDDPNPKAGDTFTERRGVRMYMKVGGAKWSRHILDDGGVAVEDLAVADLNGDGRPDIVAVGRATGNCRIYWNRGE